MPASPVPGLHSPDFERDSCGFGLIAQLDDRPSRALVDAGLQALARLVHRGAVGADGLSGDGCGLLLRRPRVFLAAIAHVAGIPYADGDACGGEEHAYQQGAGGTGIAGQSVTNPHQHQQGDGVGEAQGRHGILHEDEGQQHGEGGEEHH